MKDIMQLKKLKEIYDKQIDPLLPPVLKATAMLRGFGALKVPLLYYLRPSVVQISRRRCEVRIPFSRKSKNHLNSMYFGALSVGADCVVGMLAMHLMNENKQKNISLIFKDFRADFLKRAEGDVHFICEDGEAIQKQLEELASGDKRVNLPVHAYAIVPKISSTEPVAKFVLTLSLKKKDLSKSAKN